MAFRGVSDMTRSFSQRNPSFDAYSDRAMLLESRIADNGRRAAVRMHEEAPGAREKGRTGEGSLLIRENHNGGGVSGGGQRGDSGK